MDYRRLTAAEVAQLERQGNRAEDWSRVLVADPFEAECVWNSTFEGEVRIGALAKGRVEHEGLSLAVGIYRSMLTDTLVGSQVAIHNVAMLSGYEIGDGVLLFNVEEMTASRSVDDWAWLEPMNENGGRRLLPFAGMTIGDAYLWARYRGRKTFMERLGQFTREAMTQGGERLGRVGEKAVVKNTKAVRNVVVCSCEGDASVVDGCVVLGDGVVGYGCRVEHGVMALRFLLGEHVHLEMGLRLNDTVVGDNSTLARCEVGNSIIFPAHEQHHNNSFLIAGLIMGQSNIAAGGTIGSNHNSRTADNELAAGRGFWPGLCCSFKHSSRFASYCLLAKGDYPAELDIKLPFALVNNNVSKEQLEVMPAYWWMYNMYAMDRNSKKFAKRDKRVRKAQHVEFDNLAPDTAEEMLRGIALLEQWMAASKGGEVLAEGMEKGCRRTVVLKAQEGLAAYRQMLLFYAMKRLTARYGEQLPPESLGQGERVEHWVNLGGQLVPQRDVEQLIADTESGAIDSWDAVHRRLDSLWEAYPEQCLQHAYHLLCLLAGTEHIDAAEWEEMLRQYAAVQQYVEQQKVVSRRKDDENPFRNMTYWDEAEREAVLG
ncbi:MAG: DUF4954 family protein [Bacteroidales bacterium]|nr:DUF4954 family protein [Bacteroidales bacterium]